MKIYRPTVIVPIVPILHGYNNNANISEICVAQFSMQTMGPL